MGGFVLFNFQGPLSTHTKLTTKTMHFPRRQPSFLLHYTRCFAAPLICTFFFIFFLVFLKMESTIRSNRGMMGARTREPSPLPVTVQPEPLDIPCSDIFITAQQDESSSSYVDSMTSSTTKQQQPQLAENCQQNTTIGK